MTADEGLDAQIGALEAELSVPSEREVKERQLADLKEQRARQAAAGLQREAEARLLGIVRALGSLVDQSGADDQRLMEAARGFLDKAEVLDERFRKITLLRHEARALCEVFGLGLPDLPSAIVPAARPAVTEAHVTVQRAPIAEHGFVPSVQRYVSGKPAGRTFEELGELPGRDLILRKLGGSRMRGVR